MMGEVEYSPSNDQFQYKNIMLHEYIMTCIVMMKPYMDFVVVRERIKEGIVNLMVHESMP